MKWILALMLCVLQAFSISPEVVRTFGEKIWKNECGGTTYGLTYWNKGEPFPSFGIGHFIWYPESKTDRFQETFPKLLLFLNTQGIKLPLWLIQAKSCPWNSRDEFYQKIESAEMRSLRELLLITKDLQALFIIKQFEDSLSPLLDQCKEKTKTKKILSQLLEHPNGLYALVDYVNFKGTGTSLQERYQGEGWGLLQVLEQIPEETQTPLLDFTLSAKKILTKRVNNSPAERNETQWLKGWINRIDSYLSP